jgi:tRNA A-37 threonylcarbamoyl transferase component Bud32
VTSPIPAQLSYTPQTVRDGQSYGVGHPQIVAWLRHLLTTGDPLPHDADTVVYKPRPNLVCTVRRPVGLDVPCARLVVKRFGWRGKQHYLLSPLKRSKALKEYRTACHLLANGLHTPLPLGACEVRRWGFIQANAYAMQAMTDYVTLHTYCRTLPDGPQGVQEVIQLAAGYVQRLHDSGLWHRDLMLANFLLTGPPGKRRLYLVDLNRARRLPYMPVWLRALDAARMDWHQWQPQFLEHYSAGRHSLRYVQGMARLWGRWRTLRRRVLNVINPLRRRLGLK